jgi:peptidoglycan/LPS O-acetylase OafA/YrhL
LTEGSVFSRLYDRVVDQRTGSGWRLPQLDGLRGIAALMVLVAHVRQRTVPDDSLWWAPIERGGSGGVVLFFALSGFLLYLPWLRAELEHRPPPRFKTYAARRCLRIMPAYYFSVIAIAVLRVALGGKEPISASAIALHFAFLPTLGAPMLTVYWTLQVEEFFYWLLPALHRAVTRIGAVGLLGVTTLGSVAWIVVACVTLEPPARGTWLVQTPMFLPAFALGIFTAVRWRREGIGGRTLVVCGALLYVAYAVIEMYVMRVTDPDTSVPILEVLMAPAASMVVLGAARGGARFLEHPAMRFLGALSFSIYLWHMVVLRLAPVPHALENAFGFRVFYTFALTLPVALVGYLAIERPFLMLRPHMQAAPVDATVRG